MRLRVGGASSDRSGLSVKADSTITEINDNLASPCRTTAKLKSFKMDRSQSSQFMFMPRASLAPMLRASSIDVGEGFTCHGHITVNAGVSAAAAQNADRLHQRSPSALGETADCSGAVLVQVISVLS